MNKTQMFDELNVVDTFMAQQIIEENTAKLEQGTPAVATATSATIASCAGFLLLGILPPLGLFLLTASFIGGIVAYAIGGGFGTALRWAGRIGKVAWFVVPFFPIDLIVGACGFFFSAYAFIFLPIIFVKLNRKQLQKEIDAATSFLQYAQAPMASSANYAQI